VEGFIIDYRDPLFSILLFLLIVFVVSFFSSMWGIFRKKDEKKRIERFIGDFYKDSNDEYKELINNELLPFETLMLIAASYTKSGDFERSIDIYLFSLNKANRPEHKQYLFEHLGIVYFKAGFLQRAKEVFLRSLKLYPRNKKVLEYLAVIYEKLKDYDGALEVFNVLEELDESVRREIEYTSALKFTADKEKSIDEKLEYLLQFKENYVIQRLFSETALKQKIPLPKESENFNQHRIMDLLWYHDSGLFNALAKKGTLAYDIADAKRDQPKSEGSKMFELDVMIKLKKAATLSTNLTFEYICSECKNVYPIPFYRCPNCLKLGYCEVEPILTQGRGSETDLTF
jgi:lipopolysaccharide biosynthesis regulator YciM